MYSTATRGIPNEAEQVFRRGVSLLCRDCVFHMQMFPPRPYQHWAVTDNVTLCRVYNLNPKRDKFRLTL